MYEDVDVCDMYMCMKTWMFVTYVYVYEDVDVCDICICV